MKKVVSFYYDAFKIAFDSIIAHKLRAFLTLIGIIIGVAAVVVVGASISGLKTYVIDKVSKVLGSNHFMFTRMANTGRISDEEFERRNRRNKDVTWEEYQYIRDNCKMCLSIGAEMGAGADLNQDGIEMPSVRISGTTANSPEINDKVIEFGRYFSDAEVERSAKVCIIGTDVQDKFFPDKNPLGQTIRVRGVPLTIIGIEERKGSFFGNPLDRNVYIPISVHNQIFNRTGGLQVHGKAKSAELLQETIDNARLVLRNKRQIIGSDEDTFSVVNTDEFNSQMDQFTGAIAAVVIPITMIILVVGGIVVMNIMLVSVTERTFEVGLRKALGATKKQILLQFLIESSLLCIMGGVLGLVLAAVATQIVGSLLQMTMTITLFYMVLSVGISSLIGVLAGLYPAWKASKLDPIVALTKN